MLFIKKILFLNILLWSSLAGATQIQLVVKERSTNEDIQLVLQTSYARHEISDSTGELSFLTYTMFLFFPIAEKIYLNPASQEDLLQRTMNNWSQEKPRLKALLEKMRSSFDARLAKTVSTALNHAMFKEGQIPKYKDIDQVLLPVNDAIRLWMVGNKQLKVHAIHAKALDVYDGHLLTKGMSRQRDTLVLQQK